MIIYLISHQWSLYALYMPCQNSVGWPKLLLRSEVSLSFSLKVTGRDSTCRVLNLWPRTVGCWIIEEFVCYTLKFANFSQKQTDLSSIHDKLARNPKFLTDNIHGSLKSRVLICNTNTPLSLGNSSMCADSIFFFTSSPAKIWALYNWPEKRFQEIPSQVIILGGGVFKNWWIWSFWVVSEIGLLYVFPD